MAIKIYIDQGHNPVNPNAGAEGNGYREQDLVYEIGVRLSDILRANGYETRLSRPSPATQVGTSVASSLATRVNEANSWGANYFVSLHTNASVNPDANGAEVLVYRLGSVASDLAESVLEQLVLSTGIRRRGVVARPGLYVLRRTAMPAILVEMGFITNPRDANLMANSPDLFARGIADGIIDYVNRSVTSSAKPKAKATFYESEIPDGSGHLEENDTNNERGDEYSNDQIYREGQINDSTQVAEDFVGLPDITPENESDTRIPIEPEGGGETAREEGTETEENKNGDETYDEFLLRNNRTGNLKIQAFLGDQVLPAEGVHVRIVKDIGEISYIFFEGVTNEDGIIDGIVLPAPPIETSLSSELPDKTVIYRMEAEKDGFMPMEREIEMFDGIKTIQPLRLMAENGGTNGASENT